MKIELIKIPDDGMFWCDHPNCKKLPEYFKERQPYQSGRNLLKPGIIAAKIDCNDMVRSNRIMWYCTDCIDIVYKEVRKVLDKSLWIFH